MKNSNQEKTTTTEVKHLLLDYKPEIEKQLKALVRLANRLKLTPPTWKFGDVYDYEFEIINGIIGSGQDAEYDVEYYIEKCFDIELNLTESLKIDGDWVFACAVDHRDKVMVQIEEQLEIPIKYNPSNDTCEHCGKSYPRVKSYVIYSNETNEFKQVGKGCLKQFLGVKPESYITMFEAVSKFSPTVIGFSKNRGGRLESLAYSVDDMIRFTVHQIKKDGEFIKSEWKAEPTGNYNYYGEEIMRNVRANEGESTADKVKVLFDVFNFFQRNPEAVDVNYTEQKTVADEFRKFLPEVESILPYTDEIKTIREWASKIAPKGTEVEESELLRHAPVKEGMLGEPIWDENGQGQYVTKMVTEYTSFELWLILVKETLLKKRALQDNLKTVCSGYNYYLTSIEREKQDAIRLANAGSLKHIGTIGEKSELTLTTVGMKTGFGQYGEWVLWNLEDSDGNKFTKFGVVSNKHAIKEGDESKLKEFKANGYFDKEPSIGTTVQVMVDIVKHDVFRDEKITVLGRMGKVKTAKYIYK